MSNYREHPNLNYSTLKNLADNPWLVKNKKDISHFDGVKRGDILDMSFEDLSTFDKKYACFDGEIPTATTLQLADHVIKYCKILGITPDNDVVLELIEATNTDSGSSNSYWSNLTDSTKTTVKKGTEITESKESKLLKKFNNKQFWDYVNFQLTNDKIIVEKELLDQVQQAYKTILTHRHTAHIFDTSKRELLYQNDIYCDYEYELDGKLVKEPIKILPDVISIDHKLKIIHPFDFKMLTGFTVFSFPKRFLEMFYYIQSGLYTYALNKWVKEAYPGYRMVNYNFIVISTKNLNKPIIFDAFDYINPSKYGFEIRGKHYPGINQLIGDLKWHQENDLWDDKRELYESNGIIKLKL